MNRLLRAVCRIYPRWWWRRYGHELEALIEETQPTWSAILNLAAGASAVRIWQRRPPESRGGTAPSPLWHPSGLAPLLMSLGALTAIGIHVLTSGIAPEADEGSAAHVWQLLMAGQLPFVAWFVVRWVPSGGRRALAVSAIHVGAIAAAVFPVWWFNW